MRKLEDFKFRVWDGAKMDYSVAIGKAKIIGLMGEFTCKRWDEKWEDESVIMQSTNLKDKNGKEIYVGDILEEIDFTSKDGCNYFQGEYWMEDGGDPFEKVVRKFKIVDDETQFFSREYIGWFKTCVPEEELGKPVEGLLNGGGFKDFCVIGNIFENPEIL